MIISKTPLRISFVGGGTDFPDFYKKYGGAVLSTAINKYIYVIIKKRFDSQIHINWSKKEIVSDIEEIENEFVKAALKLCKITEVGLEVSILTDIHSEGSGLGSSSTLSVGLLNAFFTFKGTRKTAEQLAKDASKMEIEILGKPVGKQDQYIASFGGIKHFEFRKNGSVQVTPLTISSGKLKQLQNNLLLFYTGLSRKSATILASQQKNISDRISILEDMRDQTFELLNMLDKGQTDFLGTALAKGWELKKQLTNGISSADIDLMYTKALKAGALGGKIAGAGGGGFLLLYATHPQQPKIRKALSEFKEMPFSLEPKGSEIILNIPD